MVSIAEVLNQGGYATARFGKWHAGPDTQGFDVSSSDGKPGTEKNHYDDPNVTFDLTDVGVDFIKENRRGPFFLYLSHWDVHGPLVAPPPSGCQVRREARSLDKERESVQSDLRGHGRGG